MTREWILKLIIQKAQSCGFVLDPNRHIITWDKDGTIRGFESIIFDHAFAKAIWGEEKGQSKTDFTLSLILTTASCSHVPKTMPAYLFRLSEMAMVPDAVDYLEKFL
jgi:hypothetical protein